MAFRISLLLESLAGLLDADVFAHKQAGNEGGQAAGNFLGVELFQQGPIGDVGGDDGGQLGPKAVVQQAVEGADEKGGVELGAEVVQNEQVGAGGGLQQRFFLPGGRSQSAALPAC